jgi:hypothetical protein
VSSGTTISNWPRLLRVARSLLHQVNSAGSVVENWSLGGGTALMLRIDHRESRDIDIFLSDAQHLAFLDPAKRDFRFEVAPSGELSDGSRFLKLAFAGLGEIDFIVAEALTTFLKTSEMIESETLSLETVPEIKKVYHRGFAIKPRDVFDIAAAANEHADDLVRELQRFRHETATTISALEKLNPDFVSNAIAQLAIKPRCETTMRTALARTKEVLRAVMS